MDLIPGTAVALAAAAIVALAVAVAVLVGGGSEDRTAAPPSVTVPALPKPGDVLPKGTGNPPREAAAKVVAVGRLPVLGRWQLEVSSIRVGRDAQGNRLAHKRKVPCLNLALPNPPGPTGFTLCGDYRRGGLTMNSLAVPAYSNVAPARRVVLFGTVPARARFVEIYKRGGTGGAAARVIRGPRGERGPFYMIPLKPSFGPGHISWLDASGSPHGSIKLVTDTKGRLR
jgi:hypothetical protein